MLTLPTTLSAHSPQGAIRAGATLTFEELAGDDASYRVHARDDTLLRVIAGIVLLSTDDGQRLLETGEEAIVAAGTRHRLASVEGTARVLSGLRPARR